MTRDELKAIILRLACLHVAEMESWQVTYSSKARTCPTCGHQTMEPSEEKAEAHRAIYERFERAKLEAFELVSAAGVDFGYHITVSGEASNGVHHYDLQDQIVAFFKDKEQSMDGIVLDSESGCFFAYCDDWNRVDLLMDAINELDPDNHIRPPQRTTNWKPDTEDIHMGIGNWQVSLQLVQNPAQIDTMIANVQGLTD